MTTLLIRKESALAGPIIADHASRDRWSALKPGTYRCEVKLTRNPRQLRLYWALIATCFDHQDTYATREDLSDTIKVAIGHCRMIETKAGKQIAIPKSIAFGNMGQEAWAEFFDKMVAFVVAKIIPGTTDAELRRHLEDMVGS